MTNGIILVEHILILIMYVIVKFVKNHKDVEMPVILLNIHDEILEFDSYEDAERTKELFEKNSDSGHRYMIKKL